MEISYERFIRETYGLPRQHIDFRNGQLHFHNLPLLDLVKRYGTPLKLTYLPHIAEQISRARSVFTAAMQQANYRALYEYCYCTKSNFFIPVLREVLRQGAGLETSSSADVELLIALHEQGMLDEHTYIIHNGYKTDAYLENIVRLYERGFKRNYLILDGVTELQRFLKLLPSGLSLPVRIGLRMATYEPSGSPYYSSRLGLEKEELLSFYKQEISKNERVRLEMLHFFVDSGIRNDWHYWEEFGKALSLYVYLREHCNSLWAFNIGGGFPIAFSFDFSYDFSRMADKIVQTIAAACGKANVPVPALFTEFGSYTVGESATTIFRVLEHKSRPEGEHWYLLDGGLLNTVPDIKIMQQEFIVLPVNYWEQPPLRVRLGGLSCDQADYYEGSFDKSLFLPSLPFGKSGPMYVAFLHTGAYQDALGGYGGIQHCLIPSPAQLMMGRDEKGALRVEMFQKPQSGMQFLGADPDQIAGAE